MLESRKIIRVEILPKIEEKCGVKKSNDLYTVLAPHEYISIKRKDCTYG